MRARSTPLLAAAGASLLICGAARSDCSLTSLGTSPLPDSGPRFYNSFQCGLYPRGGNVRPPALDNAARALAASVQPLDSNGNPNAASGKIVMISIGMSNTTQEFASAGINAFKPRADADPSKNPRLVIVDGAQGGRDATDWIDPAATTWHTVDARLTNSGVTPQQVQVAWLKQAIANPNNVGGFPLHAQVLRDDLATIVRIARSRYPNLKLLYLTSRSRAYTNVASSLNPEPFAFEGGFSVKWLIEDQIAGRANLNWDPARGPVVAPLLVWGPYIWADGTNPRSDGFTWLCSDLQGDYTHPSPNGIPKVSAQLLAFFKTDPIATPWFLRNIVTGQPPAVTASADVTSGDTPLTVNFSANANDPDGTIASYQWTFDDGTFAATQTAAKEFRAPGNYNVHLTVTDDAGNTVQRTIPIAVRQTLAEWRKIFFTAAELNDPQISGDLADPDGDGETNLAEYALGTNPRSGESAAVTSTRSNGHLALTYPRAKFAVDAAIFVEVAANANGPWNVGDTTSSTTGDDGVVETVVATDSATDASKRFMRLRIDRVNPAAKN